MWLMRSVPDFRLLPIGVQFKRPAHTAPATPEEIRNCLTVRVTNPTVYSVGANRRKLDFFNSVRLGKDADFRHIRVGKRYK